MACGNKAACRLLKGDIEFGAAALEIVRMRFCEADHRRCARFVFQNVACEEAPLDLLPADGARLDELPLV